MPRPARIVTETTGPTAVSDRGTNDTKPPRTRIVSPAVLAATLYNKLLELDAAEAAEIAAMTPAGIRARYKAKREKTCGGSPPDVLKLLEKMRAPDPPEKSE
jgi:hypothetical protein